MKYWWDKSGLRFECVMCGKCCGGEPGSVWVSEQETSLIGGFLNINLHKLRKDFLVRKMGKLSIKEKENFHKEENGKKYAFVAGTIWFTNIEHGRLHQPLSLMTESDIIKFGTKKVFEKF